MTDEFERFIVSALAPDDREPDRRFVAKVQARRALEDRLAAQQRSLIAGFVKQLGALATIAAAIWWLSRSPSIAGRFAESPALAIAILLAGFAFLVVVLSFRTRDGVAAI